MPDLSCPVNRALTAFKRQSSPMRSPTRAAAGAEEIVALMRDVAWGRAGGDHLASLTVLASELGGRRPG